ncbi:DNA ligase [Ralstonia phage RPSC1]|uniref:DNA ligase-like protein n=1 Tax=Ralstonia phage RPSC1 TaxID=2041351 RepID=A0A2Z2U7V9_9CAUD|nr:DNA ligase [Ralstonia phage RPSC1]ATN92950.1 DNA ligase-like protein [Ralstonia phage RPSC1]
MDNPKNISFRTINGHSKAELQGALKYDERQIQAVIDRVGFVAVGNKIDGMRVEFQVSPEGQVSAVSRSSKLVPALQLALSGIPPGRMKLREVFPRGVRLDCEVTVDGLSFQKGCGELRRKQPVPLATVRIWPISFKPWGDGWPGALSDMTTFTDRHAWADTFGRLFAYAVGCQVQSLGEGIAHDLGLLAAKYAKARAAGLEGLMVYDPEGEHRCGKVLGWWKMKPEEEADGIIVDLIEGEGRLAGTMGAALVELEAGGTFPVGTGWTDAQRKELWEAYQVYQAATSLGHTCTPRFRRYVQITFMERTDDGNLRHPAFDRFRDIEGDEGVKS